MGLSNELGELIGRNPQDRASGYDVDDPRPERGSIVPLYTRWMRFLQGDPCGYGAPSSTGSANPVGLGVIPVDSRCAIIYVAGGSIIYRVDGLPPSPAGDQTIQQGSTITLTGRPTMMGFLFAGASGAVQLYISYYD